MAPWIRAVLQVTVTIAVCVALVGLVDPLRYADVLSEARPLPWLAALALSVASLAFMTRRWQRILAIDGVVAGYGTLFIICLESTFFGLFLPSGIGGDVFRGARLRSSMGGLARTFINLVGDRLVGIWSVCLLGLAALAFSPGAPLGLQRAVLVISLGILAASAVGMLPTVQAIVAGALRYLTLEGLAARQEAVFRQLWAYVRRPGKTAEVLGLSLGQQGLGIWATYFVGQAVGLHLGLEYYAALMPLVWIASFVPAIGGTGPREATLTYCLVATGVGQEQALAVSTLHLAVLVLRGIIGGLVFVADRSLTPQAGAPSK